MARVAAAQHGRFWLPPDDGRLNEVALLAFCLRRYRAAAPLMPRKPGRPVQWDRLRAAANWLRRDGFETVSDARGSRCVGSLVRFLARWRAWEERANGTRRGAPNADTAAELAGTLKALADGMGWELSTP